MFTVLVSGVATLPQWWSGSPLLMDQSQMTLTLRQVCSKNEWNHTVVHARGVVTFTDLFPLQARHCL